MVNTSGTKKEYLQQAKALSLFLQINPDEIEYKDEGGTFYVFLNHLDQKIYKVSKKTRHKISDTIKSQNITTQNLIDRSIQKYQNIFHEYIIETRALDENEESQYIMIEQEKMHCTLGSRNHSTLSIQELEEIISLFNIAKKSLSRRISLRYGRKKIQPRKNSYIPKDPTKNTPNKEGCYIFNNNN